MTDVTMPINELEIRVPISRIFNPAPDITAYELAILLPYFHGVPMYEETLTELGTAARHLK
ncbi:MAG: hypothetical protein ACO3GA_03620 [Candidatus Limnocylindrus sp.]